MQHFILTRFNLGLYDRPDAEAWMRHRCQLFERYTLPSVMRQTCGDFTWVIGFDARTPDRYLDLYAQLPRVQICNCQPSQWVKHNHNQDQYLVTSRLDNDDYIERDYVQQVQDFDELGVVDFRGRVLDVATGKYYDWHRPRPNSMFLSLIEPPGQSLMATFCEHTWMPDHFRSERIDEYGWTMVVHDRNIINKLLANMELSKNQNHYAKG